MNPERMARTQRVTKSPHNTKTMKKIITILTLALMSIAAFAQHDEQVTVEGKYRPKVNKVNKMVLQPPAPQPSYNYPNTEVNPMEASQKLALDLEKIAPTGFAAKKDQLVIPTKNFLMAGIGTRISPLFLYKHNSMLTKTLGLGVGVKHNSSWLNIKDYAPSSYMNNVFDINLTTSKFDGLQLDGGVYYKNDMYHYYGVNLEETPLTDDEIEECCPRQTYNTVGGCLGLASTSTRVGEMSHDAKVDYHYTFAKLYSREHSVSADYDIGYTQNWWGDKSHPQKVGMELGFQYEYFEGNQFDRMINETALINRSNLYLFKLNPYFEMSDEFYKLHLGVRLDGVNRVKEEDKFLAVRPDISGSLYVLNKKLEFYAGLNGGRSLVTYSELIAENPCVGSQLEMRARNVKLGFEGGVRTNIMDVVDLHLGVRYRHTDNDPLFVTYIPSSILDSSGSDIILNSFDLVYDETKLVTVMADARFKLRNSLTADLGFAYNSCKPTHEEYAWYRPTTEGRLKLTYDLNDKLSFNTSFLYQGGRYAKLFGEDGSYAQKLKDVFDLSLGADYKINDQITAFALIDNVANQKYQLYYNYPVTGIQFYAGVKLRF